MNLDPHSNQNNRQRHHHHSHHGTPQRQEAMQQKDQITERLEEKTLHGHEHAMHEDTTGHPPHGEHGHDHHRMMIADFRKRFWISLVLSIPVILLSHMVQNILGYSLQVPYSLHISFILSSIIFFYGGWPFLTGLAEEVKKSSPGMMTLIGVAITVDRKSVV